MYKQGYISPEHLNQVLTQLVEELTAIDNYPGRQAIRELDSPNSVCYELQEWKVLIRRIQRQ